MPRPFVTFPNTSQRFIKRVGIPKKNGEEVEGEQEFNEAYLEALTVVNLLALAEEEELEVSGSGAKGRVLKSDLIKALLR